MDIIKFVTQITTGNKYLQTVNISGTGSIETDYIIPLILHRGSQSGDYTNKDIFLDGKCRPDFSDIHFTDGNDVPLSHYLHGAINAETIQDSSLGNTSIIATNGKIISSCDGQIAESNDNGVTWTVLYTAAGVQIIWVDPITDLYFANVGYLLLRSDAAHTTWSTVLDMSAESGYILPYGFCESAAGVLYAGRYQATNAAEIFRSVDGGETWVSIYEVNGDANRLHIHGLDIDPATGYLYVGMDGTLAHVMRSVDPTAETVLFTDLCVGDPMQFVFGDGWRSLNSEATRYEGAVLRSSIMRTVDDVAFSNEDVRGQRCSVLRQVGSNLYGSLSAQFNERYCQIIQRDNGGIWRTFWIAPYDDRTSNNGPRWADKEATPTGANGQLIIGSDASTPYKPLRLYDGGIHYQSLVYVRIPTLPANGTTIKVYSKPGNHSSISNTFPIDFTQSGILCQYKLDEGAGTGITDSSVNNKAAVLTPGTGYWNDVGIKRAGAANPDILLPGKSYHFNGDGYITVTDSDSDTDFDFTNNFTIYTWIKTVASSPDQVIVGKGSIAGQHWALIVHAGVLQFSYNTVDLLTISTNIISDGSAHFISLSIDADDKYITCIDGKTSALTALSPVLSATAGLVRIGADASGLAPYTGDEDNVEIYNTAHTAAQMRQVYENRSFATTEPGIYYPAQSVVYDGAATVIDCGNDATIQNLHDGAVTIEGWFNPTGRGEGNLGEFISKGAGRWQYLYTNSGNTTQMTIYAATTSSAVTYVWIPGTGWHHVEFTYDDAGDRKLRMFVDGTLVSTGVAAVGAIVSDADKKLMIGNADGTSRHFAGSSGWVRISNIIRHNFAFSPPPRHIYPAVDANTVRLFKINEGTGTDIIDYSANAKNGTLASGTWLSQ